MAQTAVLTFPRSQVENGLRPVLERLHEDLKGMREPWACDLDSLSVVEVVVVVNKILHLDLAPEKLVRRGGYKTVEEAVTDITARVEEQFSKKHR